MAQLGIINLNSAFTGVISSFQGDTGLVSWHVKKWITWSVSGLMATSWVGFDTKCTLY